MSQEMLRVIKLGFDQYSYDLDLIKRRDFHSSWYWRNVDIDGCDLH